MLSWFKKKSAAPEAEPAAPQAVVAVEKPSRAGELIKRWDVAIAEIHARLHAVLSEAVIGSGPIIAKLETDLTPLVLPWNTITPRMRESCEELAETWNTLSDEMSDSGDFTHEMMAREGNKRDLAGLELELMHDRMYGSVMARAAEHMRQRALGSDAAAHTCKQCGAKLDKVTPVSASLNVECGYCKSINTIHPGTALRMFAASGAIHLAAEVARAPNEAMRRCELRIKQYRDAKDVPLALLIELEATSRTYWTTRLEEEAKHNPEEQKYVAAKLERYMKDVQRTLRRYWQWREHEGTAQ
jgi:hypothetical protein